MKLTNMRCQKTLSIVSNKTRMWSLSWNMETLFGW